MKILHVPNAYFPVIGGAENICRRFSEILASQGHEVHVVTTDVGAVQAYYEFGVRRVERADETIGGVTVTRLPFSNSFYQMGGWVERKLRPEWLSTRLTRRIMQVLHRRLAETITRKIAHIRPDVVMTMPHLVANVQAVLTARQRMSFPLVMVPMLHEHDPNWHVGAMSAALRATDAVVALTGYEKERLATAYGVPRDRIFMASVGVDIDEMAPPLATRPERIIFLGRKVRSKGIAELIDAMRLVWAVMPRVELWLAGVRVSETSEIDRQIAELPLEWRKRVKDVGAISDVDKADFLRSALCLVLPSKIESFGMVILEAWAHATPVVGWDLPVFRAIVDHGRTGLLADPCGGTRALGEAILQILQNPKAAAQMGETGQRQAASAYSWKSVAAAYLKAYEYAARREETARLQQSRKEC
jgi:glycosyltransferase involved in cell wall biosynthesis